MRGAHGQGGDPDGEISDRRTEMVEMFKIQNIAAVSCVSSRFNYMCINHYESINNSQ